jgi:hypothetical protein
MNLVGYLYEDYHDARSLERKATRLVLVRSGIISHSCHSRILLGILSSNSITISFSRHFLCALETEWSK